LFIVFAISPYPDNTVAFHKKNDIVEVKSLLVNESFTELDHNYINQQDKPNYIHLILFQND
jgi:hypothetical protein